MKIKYTFDKGHDFIGQPPKLKRLHRLMYDGGGGGGGGGDCCVDQQLVQVRTNVVLELEGLHSALVHLGILSPRDQWEDWIDNFKSELGCDPAFMCLLIILMSSSTADNQLAHIIPRLFSSGLTSSSAVIEVAQQYGLDTFCALLSESGRFYQNAERILNAADYFVQRHGGRIPSDITILELCTLFGVGYKTANIVVTTAFRRVDGIPSDIHVIRWSSMLGWCESKSDGLKCSKLIEAWLPRSKWESINPIFGSFGQLLVSNQRDSLLSVARQHPSPRIRQLFRKAAQIYKKSKKAS
jgi:endonuclease-3